MECKSSQEGNNIIASSSGEVRIEKNRIGKIHTREKENSTKTNTKDLKNSELKRGEEENI